MYNVGEHIKLECFQRLSPCKYTMLLCLSSSAHPSLDSHHYSGIGYLLKIMMMAMLITNVY